jgi:hypothetical protein
MVPSYIPFVTTNSASISNSESSSQRKRSAPSNKRNSNGSQIQTDVSYNGTAQENVSFQSFYYFAFFANFYKVHCLLHKIRQWMLKPRANNVRFSNARRCL